jgi:outer membrane protein assembly factor BamA
MYRYVLKISLLVCTAWTAWGSSPPAERPSRQRGDDTASAEKKAVDDTLDNTRRQFMQKGHLNAVIQDSSIVPGPRYRIHEIELVSQQDFSLKDMGLTGFVGQTASAEIVSRIREQVSRYLMNSGFLFFTLRFDLKASGKGAAPDEKLNKVSLKIEIDAGAGFKLGAVQVHGTRTKPAVLARLSLLKPGEPYSPRRVELAGRKLARSGYFRHVEKGRLYRDSVRHLLYPTFHLSDIRHNNISGLFGYSSEEDAPGSGLTGFLDVALFNLAGSARDFDFHFYGETGERRITVKYLEPWIWTLPIGAILDWSLLLEDSVYNERNAGVTLFQDIDFHSKYMLSYAHQKNEEFRKDAHDSLMSRKSSAVITGIQTLFDWRDAVPHTLKGGIISVGFNGIRRNTSDSISYLLQNKSSAGYWLPLGDRFIVRSRVGIASAWPLEKSLANRGNLFQVGGANSLRGFRENEFLTNLYIYANLELQFLLSPGNRIFLLADPGLINRNSGDIYWQRVLGYGLGANLGTGDWIFGISYALNTRRSLEDGLVHVRVVNSF